ncbi:hypothetical protein CSE45_5346 [Citreicella sp. SE45]|nr:hypothetical protein CSE45_5346 [Citreicella sp. SE45]
MRKALVLLFSRGSSMARAPEPAGPRPRESRFVPRAMPRRFQDRVPGAGSWLRPPASCRASPTQIAQDQSVALL